MGETGDAQRAAGGFWDDNSRVLRITVPMPDYRLTLNQARSQQSGPMRSRLMGEAHSDAVVIARGLLHAVGREGFLPFPAGMPVFVALDVERKKHGQRWDTAALIEAMKPTMDAWNGLLWADDKQIVGFAVRWDPKPTGRGVVTVTIRDTSMTAFF